MSLTHSISSGYYCCIATSVRDWNSYTNNNTGFIGLTLSYGLTLNMVMVVSLQNQCILANHIISVERIKQYMNIPSEAPEVIDDRRPPQNWPLVGKVEICNLQVNHFVLGLSVIYSGKTTDMRNFHVQNR